MSTTPNHVTVAERERTGPAVSGPNRPLDSDAVDWVHSWGHRIGIQLFHQNREAAYTLVAAALEDRRVQTRHPLLTTPLPEIGVDVKSANALERHLGITTVEGLLNTTVHDMRAIPMFGEAMAFEVQQALARHLVQRVLEHESNQG